MPDVLQGADMKPSGTGVAVSLRFGDVFAAVCSCCFECCCRTSLMRPVLLPDVRTKHGTAARSTADSRCVEGVTVDCSYCAPLLRLKAAGIRGRVQCHRG